MIAYYNGTYCQKSQVAISPDDRGFLFADGVYEVIRAYSGRLFKLSEHMDRLAYGLKELRIHGVAPSLISEIATRILQENGLERSEAVVYLQITRGSAPRRHRFPEPGTTPTVYVEAKPFSPPIELQKNGAAAIIVPDQRWTRCDIKTTMLLPNTIAHQQAHEEGAFEAILSRDGVLLEGSHSTILFVKDGILVAPPLTNHVLPGVTRGELLALASRESIPTCIRTCFEREVCDFQEVLMVGTTIEVVPLTSVNGQRIGDGTAGPIAKRLQNTFRVSVDSFLRASSELNRGAQF